jgi:hypothetical protein
MPLSAAHWTAVLLIVAISHTTFPAAVVTKPHGAVRRDRDAEARIALLAAKLRALRAGGFLIAVAVVSKADANSSKFIVYVHQ